jgi:hypothetical protein
MSIGNKGLDTEMGESLFEGDYLRLFLVSDI